MAQTLLNCTDLTGLLASIKLVNPARTSGDAGLYVGEIQVGENAAARVFIKIAPFHGEMPTDGSMHVTSTELNVMRALKTKIIDQGYTPHITEILGAIMCSSVDKALVGHEEECAKIVHGKGSQPGNAGAVINLLCWFRERIRAGTAIDKFAIIISELSDISFENFLLFNLPSIPSAREIVIRAMLFQVYFTLAVIGRIFPDFHHGDMHPRNIMIKNEPFGIAEGAYSFMEKRAIAYEMDGITWHIPYMGYIAKLIDFGHSHMPSEGIHSGARFNTIGVRGNRLPDHIVLILTIQRLMTRIAPTHPRLFSAIMPIINPQGITESLSVRVIADEFVAKTPTLEEILKGPLFAQFAREHFEKEQIIKTFHMPPITAQ